MPEETQVFQDMFRELNQYEKKGSIHGDGWETGKSDTDC